MVRRRDFEFLTYEQAAAAISYNPDSGDLTWKASGRRAGHIDKYIQVRINGRMVLGHRLGWLLHHGEWPPAHLEIDHINRDKRDNRITNLRLLTRSKNNRNSARSDVGGVCFCKQTGRWKAYVNVNYRQRWLGRYATEGGARLARELAMLHLT